jgi:hypothetical protein
MEGQEYKHLLDYMNEKKDRKNSIFDPPLYVLKFAFNHLETLL